MDGVKVISESGRKFETKQQGKKTWLANRFKASSTRPKSNDYELHVVADGIEVRLEGESVWAIRVA